MPHRFLQRGFWYNTKTEIGNTPIWKGLKTLKGGAMRKHILWAGSLAAVLLIAFLGGMQLGQAQMYDSLIFGDQKNEIYIKVVQNDEFFVKRYRDQNRIGLVKSAKQTNDDLAQLEERLSSMLNTIQGLDSVEIADDELMLFKLDNFNWEDILNQVLLPLSGR